MSDVRIEFGFRPSGLEVTEHLQSAGVAVISTMPDGTGITVAVEDGQEQAALDATAGWTPATQVDPSHLDTYVSPLPDDVRTHLQHLRDYLAADPTTITTAQTTHVVKDTIRALFYLNKRFETEG